MKRPRPISEPSKEMVKLLKDLSYHRSIDTTFNDFLEVTAYCISNSVDRYHAPDREEKYLAIAKRYTNDELKKFSEILGCLILALEKSCGEEVFGPLIVEFELGALRKHLGQIFSPWGLCKMMAQMNLGSKESIEKAMGWKGYVTTHDPCCGSGIMTLAMAQTMTDFGVNFQTSLHATLIDIDIRCVHMAYLQLALVGIPAVITHGDSLRMILHSHWYTPMHIIGGWQDRFRTTRMVDAMKNLLADTADNAAPDQPEPDEPPITVETMPPADIVVPPPSWSPTTVAFPAYPVEGN